MNISYTIYNQDDEVESGGLCDIAYVPLLTTDALLNGNTIVLEQMDD